MTKTNTKFLFFFVICFFTSLAVQAQINTFPYTEDFENPSVVQSTPASCDLTVAGATFSNWTQDPNDDGDWRADSAGTPSVATGPGSGINSSGVGVGTDVNPGTTSGIYIYTEASGTCSNTTINLISEYFDLSAASTYYQLQFHYHMYGFEMGSLAIDFEQDGTWYLDQWKQSGSVDSTWQLATVSMADFNTDSIRVRIRARIGINYESDIAIDNFRIASFTPPNYDAVLWEIDRTYNEYPIMPISQFDSMYLYPTVENEGLLSITGTSVAITEGSFQTASNPDTVFTFQPKTEESYSAYVPTTTGTKTFNFSTSIDETETNTTNNSGSLSFEVSDTVLARETGEITGGIGTNTGTIEIGNKFDVYIADTLTSISFNLAGPTTGDSVRLHLRAFNGIPGNDIQVSQNIVATGAGWYTVLLDCPEILSPGTYFVGVEQLVANSNMSLAYTNDYYNVGTSYYGNGTTWTEVSAGNFEVTLLIRQNFGYLEAGITASADSVCQQEILTLETSGYGAASWTPSSGASSPNTNQTNYVLDQNTTIAISMDYGCGIVLTDNYDIAVSPSPVGTTSVDTTICIGTEAVLSASGGDSYTWLNGPTDANLTVSPTSNTTFYVTIDSANGCSRILSTIVDVSVPVVIGAGDTTICAGTNADLSASGAQTYQWLNGPATANYSANASSSQFYYVSGFNNLGCEAIDSVYVTTIDGPALTPIADTGGCFATNLVLVAGGAANLDYEWSTGSDSMSTNYLVLGDATVYLEASLAGGCKSHDTIQITRFLPPNSSIDADTTICEGTSPTISAYGGASYVWSHGPTTQAVTISPTQPTTYSVEVFNAQGCSSNEEIDITIDPLPFAAFTFKRIQDSVSVTNTSADATSYMWDFGDGNTSTNENDYNIYDTSGTYTITLTATNSCGSVDSSVDVTVNVPIMSVEDLKDWNNLIVQPNPTFGSIDFSIQNSLYGKLNIEVSDAQGRFLFEKSLLKSQNQIQGDLNLNEFAPGVYYIEFKIGSSRITQKVVKH